MKKLLFAFSVLFLFSACSQQNEATPVEELGNKLELSFRNNAILTQTYDSLLVYDIKKRASSQHMIFSQYTFAAGAPIVLQDIEPVKHTIFALANLEKDLIDNFTTPQENEIYFEIRGADSLPEIMGGVVNVEALSETATIKMTRLVGGVTINIQNLKDFPGFEIVEVYFSNTPSSTVIEGTEIRVSSSVQNLKTDGILNYVFPTEGPVKGMVFLYSHDYYQSKTFEFTAKHAVEANKKLELNLTLSQLNLTRSVQPTVVCTEKVSDL